MKKLILIFTLLFAAQSYSQSVSSFETAMDNYLASNAGKWVTVGARYSASGGDNYFEGFTAILGLTRAWQASGRNDYLDLALDIVDFDIANSTNLEDFYDNNPNFLSGGAFWRAKFDNLGMPMSRNMFRELKLDGSGFNKYNPNWDQYFANRNLRTPEGLPYAYGYMSYDPDQHERVGSYIHIALDDNIYWRYVADMARIMYNNQSNNSLFSQTSNTGETYQTRYNRVKAHLEDHIWGKWVEGTQLNWNLSSQFRSHVYRGNTHMSSHLASTALSLYIMSGETETKYLNFTKAFLYNFSSNNPDSPTGIEYSTIPANVGFLDQLVNLNNGYNYRSIWGSFPGTAQDISHGGAEVTLIVQCFEEGLFSSNPPSGDTEVITSTEMARWVATFKDGVIIGDPATSTQVRYRIDGSGGNWWNKSQLQQGWYELARYDATGDLLSFIENNPLNAQSQVYSYGVGMYTAAVLNANGSSDPVYPSNGVGGSTPIDNAPIVVLNGDANVNIALNANYTDPGAEWTDDVDGSGTIAAPTSGSIDNTTPGAYLLTYSYTDTGGTTRSVTRIVTVSDDANPNSCPVIQVDNPVVYLTLNELFIDPGAVWIDAEDGTGVNVAVSGDTVDTSVAGEYIVTYTYTDTDGCPTSESVRFIVQEPGQVLTAINWDTSRLIIELDSIIPNQTVNPLPLLTIIGGTEDDVELISNKTNIAGVNANSELVLQTGGSIQLTARGRVNNNISSTMTLIIVDLKAKKERASLGW